MQLRKNRFLKSKRWELVDNKLKIKQSLFDIEIEQIDDYYYLSIHKLRSEKKYQTLDDAKASTFDVIESGELYAYLDKHKINYRKSKK